MKLSDNEVKVLCPLTGTECKTNCGGTMGRAKYGGKTMIKIENTETYGWKAAIRGMRNPLESWKKSDSLFNIGYLRDDNGFIYMSGYDICDEQEEINMCSSHGFTLGDADLALMKKLVAAGTDHSKFMRMINVSCDIIAPLYWWKEMDTYKVGTVANSCSTMHCIHKKEFTIDDFSHEHLEDDINMKLKQLISNAKANTDVLTVPLALLRVTIGCLNVQREAYLKTKDKRYWWQMIQLLPSSYNQRRTVMLNYAVLRNIYHARKNHKLDEWRDFCEWIEGLPYSELITEKSNE